MADNQVQTIADIRRICGEQGSGKSTTGAALVVDDCYDKLTGIVNLKTGERRKARALYTAEIDLLKTKGVKYHQLKHIRVWSPDEKSSKIIVKPDGWVIESPVRVFSNFTFYGIKYRPIDDITIIEKINSDVISDCWLVLDESTLTDKQDTMSREGKFVARLGAQIRKRNIHFVMITQYANMIQTRFNLFETTSVECTYDEDTYIISATVTNKSKFMNSVDIYAPDYWKFFNTRERIEVPQHKIDKYLEDINKPKRN